MTDNAYIKAKQDLYNIIANHAHEDYIRANFKNGKRIKYKHIPYSLCYDARKAKEIYDMIFYTSSHNDITPEQEEKIKGFLLVYRTSRTDYLKDRGGQKYHQN